MNRTRIKTKRVYERPSPADGVRILVDRLWPRGLSKRNANIDVWLKDIAPSDALRKWFHHDPEKWPEFKKRYFRELEDREQLIGRIQREAGRHTVSLLFGAKEEQYNNAVALAEYLWNN